MSVAVIVPVYNRDTIVLKALAGVAAQTSPPTQLIVVDDGSTDETAPTVRRWLRSRSLPFTSEVITQKNGGVSSARNRGLCRVTDCRYVAFLDSDDVWPKDFLERAGQALASCPRAVAATADRRYEDSINGTQRSESLEGIGQDALRWLMTKDGGIASATLLDSQAIRRRGAFDETLKTGEDVALFLPLSLDGRWLHLPGAPVTFGRGNSGPGEADNLSDHFVDNQRRWARIYDGFVRAHAGHPSLPADLCSRVIAGRWYSAGRELMRGGRVQEARECFHHSTQWRFLNKAWLRMVTSYCHRAA